MTGSLWQAGTAVVMACLAASAHGNEDGGAVGKAVVSGEGLSAVGKKACCGKPKLLVTRDVRLTPDTYKKVTGVNILAENDARHVFLKWSPGAREAPTFLGRLSFYSMTNWRIGPQGVIHRFGEHGGGTPSALKYRGTYHVWFREDSESVQEISLLTSRDMTSWEYTPKVVEVDRAGWDSSVIAGVDVSRDGDWLRMYYRGSAFENQMQSDVGLAVSRDGKTWTRYAANPVFKRARHGWDSALLGDPHVFKADGRYFMLYSGHDNQDLKASDSADTVGRGKKIGLAVSMDGIRWRRCFDGPMVEYGVKADNPFAVLDQGILHLWFRTTDYPSGAGGRIVYQRYAFGEEQHSCP